MCPACAFTSDSHFNLGRHQLKCGHERNRFLDTGWKPDETVKRDYAGQPSGFEQGENEVACQEDGSLSFSVETPIIIEKGDEVPPEKLPSFLIAFADFPLRFANHVPDERHCSWSIFYLVHPSMLECKCETAKDFYRTTMKPLEIQRSSRNDGICRVLVRGVIRKKEGCSTLYVTDATYAF